MRPRRAVTEQDVGGRARVDGARARAVVPSGVVIATSTTTATMTAANAISELAAAERTDEAVALALVGELGSLGHSDRRVEGEVARQQREPVEHHRHADGRDEQAADQRDDRPWRTSGADHARRPVVDGGDQRGTAGRGRACRRRAGSRPGDRGRRSRPASGSRRG